jgi:uncharacterized phage protein (TIGR01671 family)
MSREIKFRAWDKRIKKFFGNDDFALPSNGNSHTGFYLCRKTPNCDEICGDFNNNEDIIIMQFTGLKDKQGKEIYEGDIVRRGDVSEKNLTVVFFRGEFIGLKRSSYLDFKIGGENDFPRSMVLYNLYSPQIEVIGNIYENPELCRTP